MDDIELEDVNTNIGLTTTEATRILQNTIKEELKHYSKSSRIQFVHDIIDTFYTGKNSPIDWFGACLVFCEAALLFAGYHLGDENTTVTPLVEGLIVSICAIFVAVICIRENRLQRSEVERSFRGAFKRRPDGVEGDTYIDVKCPKSSSITMTGTYRDNKLVNLPWNLLVEGDVVVLGTSEIAPTHIKQILDGKNGRSVPFCLDAGEVFNPPFTTTRAGIQEAEQPSECQPYPDQKFLVMETPIKRCIRSTFQHCNQRPQSVLNHDMRRILVFLRKKVFWFFLILSLFVNFVRYRLEPATVGHYSEVLLLATAYVILPLTPIIFPILWILVSLYGAARIKAAFKHAEEVKTGTASAVWEVEDVNFKWTLEEFWKLIRGDPACLSRTANLLHTLGNVTVFCCVDKLGVLCYPNLTPAKVFIFKNTQSNEQSLKEKRAARFHSECSDADEDVKASVEFPDIEVTLEPYDTEVLSLSYDTKSANGIQFDDEGWKNHMESLKPLGLNLMLNSPCPFPFKRLIHENFTGHISLAANCSPVPNIRRCSCPLAREIGFHDRVTDGFSRHGQIFTFRPVHASELSVIPSDVFLSIVKDKLVPSMISVIAKDNASGMFQLLTQGSADLVLDACTDFWDGEDLCELTNDDRKKALDFYQRMSTTGHCIAFAYRPLIERSCAKFENDVFIQCPGSVKFPSLDCDTGSSCSLPPKKISESEDVNESVDGELAGIYEESHENQIVNTKDANDLVRMLGKQIFIGMVTYSDLVKEDTECLVESLNNGGIRFVYFSTENELKSRVFAGRLGLETGWNCHISLANCEPLPYRGSLHDSSDIPSENDYLIAGSKSNIAEVNDDRRNTAYYSGSDGLEKEKVINQPGNQDNFYLISNRAKLPRGIRNIRPHLKHVDDVPLLVPLFTDCTPQAVTEMIEIMQENGEVVCCLGSSLNAWNSHIFSQADVSIAIDPLHPQVCVKSKSNDYRSGGPMASEDNCDRFEVSSLLLSSFLNSLPCSLLCRQDKQIDFVSLICEARRLMFNMRSCFLFMLSATLSLSFAMLVSFCFLLPIPFSGLTLLWLELFIIPLLSLSLLGTPADAELMTKMTGKRIANVYEEAKHYFSQFFPTFGLNAAFTMVGLFAWMLFSFCVSSHGPQGECSFMFGAKNLTDPWHGWITVNKEGLYMSQDITLFFTTFYLVVLSASCVHRNHHLWKRLPFSNKLWTKSVIICLVTQSIYTAASLYISNVPGIKYDFRIQHAGYPLILAILWPFALIAACELVKRKHIKMFIRYQKRERLKFDTKLGMNSPV